MDRDSPGTMSLRGWRKKRKKKKKKKIIKISPLAKKPENSDFV